MPGPPPHGAAPRRASGIGGDRALGGHTLRRRRFINRSHRNFIFLAVAGDAPQRRQEARKPLRRAYGALHSATAARCVSSHSNPARAMSSEQRRYSAEVQHSRQSRPPLPSPTACAGRSVVILFPPLEKPTGWFASFLRCRAAIVGGFLQRRKEAHFGTRASRQGRAYVRATCFWASASRASVHGTCFSARPNKLLFKAGTS